MFVIKIDLITPVKNDCIYVLKMAYLYFSLHMLTLKSFEFSCYF